MAKSPVSAPSFEPHSFPDFSLPVSGGGTVTRESLKGKWTVIFFYPADDTETCTKEACAFSEAAPDFARLGVDLYGLSKDSLRAHDKFITKYGLKMKLLSDESTATIDAVGSWIEKSMYGRQYMGTDRSTFIIDPDGLIRKEWRKVRIKGHVETVLAELKKLKS